MIASLMNCLKFHIFLHLTDQSKMMKKMGKPFRETESFRPVNVFLSFHSFPSWFPRREPPHLWWRFYSKWIKPKKSIVYMICNKTLNKSQILIVSGLIRMFQKNRIFQWFLYILHFRFWNLMCKIWSQSSLWEIKKNELSFSFFLKFFFT